jgi:hypothetical protein
MSQKVSIRDYIFHSYSIQNPTVDLEYKDKTFLANILLSNKCFVNALPVKLNKFSGFPKTRNSTKSVEAFGK